MLRTRVLAIFEDEAAANLAVEGLKGWAREEAIWRMVDTHQLQAIGVLTLDEHGQVQTRLIARHPTWRRGLGLGDQDRERLGRELREGRAAVGVITDKTSAEGIAAELAELGGTPDAQELDEPAAPELRKEGAHTGVSAATPPSDG